MTGTKKNVQISEENGIVPPPSAGPNGHTYKYGILLSSYITSGQSAVHTHLSKISHTSVTRHILHKVINTCLVLISSQWFSSLTDELP